MDKQPSPSLLPIFRSQQQAELLALLLGDTTVEASLTELAGMTGTPYPSVHREIERAQKAGLVTSRKIGNTRLIRANVESPYYEGLADVLVKAFGPVSVLAKALEAVPGIENAYVFGSWAARKRGDTGDRPVGDVDLLVIGSPDRDELFEAAGSVETSLGREVQVTIRPSGWLDEGSGSFYETVTTRPIVEVVNRLA